MWLDIVNLNQNAKDITAELSIIPMIYKENDRHRIFSLECFFRGWCLLEICTANEDNFSFMSELITEDGDYNLIFNSNKIVDSHSDRDFIAENVDFKACKFTVEGDRTYVTDEIIKKYKSIDQFNLKLGIILEGYIQLFTKNLSGDNALDFTEESTADPSESTISQPDEQNEQAEGPPNGNSSALDLKTRPGNSTEVLKDTSYVAPPKMRKSSSSAAKSPSKSAIKSTKPSVKPLRSSKSVGGVSQEAPKVATKPAVSTSAVKVSPKSSLTAPKKTSTTPYAKVTAPRSRVQQHQRSQVQHQSR
jgi:hypothetical protein